MKITGSTPPQLIRSVASATIDHCLRVNSFVRGSSLLVLATLGLATAGFAVTIDVSYLLGTVSPVPNSSPATELAAFQTLIGNYNAGILSPVFSGGSTYDVNAGSNIPLAPLPTLFSVSGSQIDLNAISGSIDVGVGNSYLLTKVGNNFGVYYIGGLTGTQTLTNDVFFLGNTPSDISHYVLSNTQAGAVVPEGGSTVLLLGGALCLLRLFRRRLSRI
jgi:hypothetical protein